MEDLRNELRGAQRSRDALSGQRRRIEEDIRNIRKQIYKINSTCTSGKSLSELEFIRSTTSLSLTEEKNILR